MSKKQNKSIYIKSCTTCPICMNNFKINDIIYVSLCCKTKICSKCLLTWHLINNSYICPNCGKNNKNIFDYEYTYYGTLTDKNLEKFYQKNENINMDNEEKYIRLNDKFDNGELIQCEYCNNIWDGNAQCDCNLNFYDT